MTTPAFLKAAKGTISVPFVG